MLKLEDLQGDILVAGFEPSASVKGLYVKEGGEDAADVTHDLLDGRVLRMTLFRNEEARLSVARESPLGPSRPGPSPSSSPPRRRVASSRTFDFEVE